MIIAEGAATSGELEVLSFLQDVVTIGEGLLLDRRALGAVGDTSTGSDFADAMSLTLFSGGVWSRDASDAVNNLPGAGCPADKIFYYRGGV